MLHQGLQPKMAASYEPIQEKAARVLMRDIIENPDRESNRRSNCTTCTDESFLIV